MADGVHINSPYIHCLAARSSHQTLRNLASCVWQASWEMRNVLRCCCGYCCFFFCFCYRYRCWMLFIHISFSRFSYAFCPLLNICQCNRMRIKKENYAHFIEHTETPETYSIWNIRLFVDSMCFAFPLLSKPFYNYPDHSSEMSTKNTFNVRPD